MHKFQVWVQQSKAIKRFSGIAMLVCVAYFVLLKINHRDGMADFRVYYDAAKAILNETQLYGIAFGVTSGFYKYAPVAALPFVPFALIPFPASSGVYYLLLSCLIIGFALVLVYKMERYAQIDGHKRGLVLTFTILFLADHLERELHVGNVNLLLLIGAFAVFACIQQNKYKSAGVIYAFMLLTKPHFVILIPYFIIKKQWKILAFTIIGAFGGLLLPILWKGWSGNLLWLEQWKLAMQDHNIQLQNSPNTIYGIITRFIAQPLGFDTNFVLIIVVLAIVGIGILWLIHFNNKNAQSQFSTYIEYFLLVALIPNLAHTDTEHFMWSWPLIAFAIHHLVYGKRQLLLIVLLVFAFIPYCLNSPDLVGKELRWHFDEGGLMGIANLIIIGVCVTLFLQTNKARNLVMKKA